jgi:hypothetical protein
MRQQDHRLVHVAHAVRREHRLIRLDQTDDVRARHVAVIHHDELGPVHGRIEAHLADPPPRRPTPHGCAPPDARDRKVVHVSFAPGQLGEAFTTVHGGILTHGGSGDQGPLATPLPVSAASHRALILSAPRHTRPLDDAVDPLRPCSQVAYVTRRYDRPPAMRGQPPGGDQPWNPRPRACHLPLGARWTPSARAPSGWAAPKERPT